MMNIAVAALRNVNHIMNDKEVSVTDRAQELDLTGYSLLSIGRNNALFARSPNTPKTDDDVRPNTLNIPQIVLEKRADLESAGTLRHKRPACEKDACAKLAAKATPYAPSNGWTAGKASPA